jgi:hypothetical protein
MSADKCMCGATDCAVCGPLQGYSLKRPTPRDYEQALEEVVECVLEHGQWPNKGRAQFDLYDYLMDRDPSYAAEMYVASLSNNEYALQVRRDRERKTVEALLTEHLRDSHWVADLAAEYAEEE